MAFENLKKSWKKMAMPFLSLPPAQKLPTT